MTHHAPIALFIYRRPDHLQRSLDTLLRCPELADSPLHVFADGPRDAVDLPHVEASRRVAQSMLGERAVYHLSPRNLGLSRSIIHGVSELLREHDRVIVLEDDLELDPGFLAFMNAALERYAAYERVMQVSGYMFQLPSARPRSTPYCLPFPSSWGWATWRRAWQAFEPEAPGWQALGRDRKLRHRFDLDGIYSYSNMLEATMSGRRDSWAVRWYWSIFQREGRVVYPPRTLVRNGGFDGSGTHGRAWLRSFGARPEASSALAFDLSPEPGFERADYDAVRRAIWKQNGGLLGQGADRVRRVLQRLAARLPAAT